ncbi:MAG: hypothetical protein MUQ30_20755, partial [Anaerolineae bacterium]|nr:hypothetical protein [Anaerolineae bacterium]
MHTLRSSGALPEKHNHLRWVSLVAGLLAIALGMSGSLFVVGRSPPPELLDLSQTTSLAGTTVFYTTTLSIPTYPYAAYLEPATSATYNMTYPVLDWDRYEASNPSAGPQDYELLVME